MTAAAASCTSAAAATYRHAFNGAARTVTITAVRPLCAGQAQAFSLVSYTAGAPGSAHGQFVYDSVRGTISAGKRSVTLDVAVPACYAQVDAIMGTALHTETTSAAAPYGTATLGSATGPGSRSAGSHAWYAGGNTDCTASTTVTFANACDGTFTATLANGDAANVPAVFLTGGRRIRVSPGRSTTVKAAKGTTLTIRASDFTTYVGTWRAPTAPCTNATQPAPAQVAGPSTAPTQAAASASPTVTATSAAAAEPAAPVFSTNPAALATAEPSALAQTGMSTGSLIAIAIGLLMMGGGATALTYLVRNLRRPA